MQRQLEDRVTAEGVEVVIVGGGAAGCVLARRLVERGRSVLLCEAGPDLGNGVGAALLDGWRNPSGPAWTADWGYESEPGADGNPTKLRRGKLLGEPPG